MPELPELPESTENSVDALPAAPAAAPVEAPAEAPTEATAEAPREAPTEATAVAAEAPAGILSRPPELSPQQTGTKLVELFPALFAAMPVLPLKLRIQADIQERAPGVFTKKGLSIFLHRYTTGTPYLIALAQAPARADLDGAPAGEIAAEHREAATVELQRRREANAARRAAERAAAGRDRHVPSRAMEGQAQGQPPNQPHQRNQPHQPHQPEHPQHAEHAEQPRAHRPERPSRPRPAAPPRPEGQQHPSRPHHQHPSSRRDGPAPLQRPAPSGRPSAPPRQAAPREPEDPVRRERALLLRAFEGSTLSRANFCALKRIAEADLEAALTLARQERSQR